MPRKRASTRRAAASTSAPAAANVPPRTVGHPIFAQPEPTPDPTTFVVRHPSDNPAYKEIDELNREHKIAPLPFPAPRGVPEPRLTLQQVLGGTAPIAKIQAAGQIVFHSTGDCGSTKGPKTQNEVVDKMVADFSGEDAAEVPQFNLLLGDVVYSFGEAQYYYDQFYEPYRDYAAPILAVPGNHDGMISPLAHATSLAAYLRNFCATDFAVTPDAGGLSRTAQIQPGVFYTFEAPFLRILALYSNTLEDPGCIANPTIGSSQIAFLQAALARVKAQNFQGALLFAHHHPPYTAGSRHNWSVDMQRDIDKVCAAAGVWPHAVLSGHAHNYQRFTRQRPGGTTIPYLVCGNGGHGLQKLSRSGTLRAPQVLQKASGDSDQIVLENYDDQDYGYLRIVVSASQLRIEYHPASDGAAAKTPDDFVTIDLKTRQIVHYDANDLGTPAAAARVRQEKTKPAGRRR